MVDSVPGNATTEAGNRHATPDAVGAPDVVDGKRVAVVMPARNAASTIERQLRALERQTGVSSFTVVVVDNGSTDGTADVVGAHHPICYSLRVVNEARRGINHARNAGVAAVDADVIALCDADDEVHDTWLAELVQALEPGAWAGGALDYGLLNSARTLALWDAPLRSEPGTTADPYVDRTFGCNCAFHRSMWEEIGGFETSLSGAGADENEMFLRAHAAGYRYRDAPAAVVGYRLRPTRRQMVRHRFGQGRNQIRMQAFGGRHLPTQHTRSSTAVDLARCVAALPRYVVQRRTDAWLGTASRRCGRCWQAVVGDRRPS